MIRKAVKEDLPAVLELMRDVFLAPRGRSVDFDRRYPACFHADTISNVMLAEDDGRLVALVAAKRRTVYDSQSGNWSIGMIGGVSTRPECRGRGIASQLMQEQEYDLFCQGVDALVLWTGIHSFYERLGWNTSDSGRLGFVNAAPKANSDCEIRRGPFDALMDIEFAPIRARHDGVRIERNALDAATIPIPADEVFGWHARSGEREAYALVGRQHGGNGFLYEMEGDCELFDLLLADIFANVPRLWINDHPGSAIHPWVSLCDAVVWEAKPLGMWKIRPGRSGGINAGSLFVSMIDRI